MATISLPEPGERVLLPDVDWASYERLLTDLDDRLFRVTYDRGNLEVMSPSYRHEVSSRTLGRFVEIVAEETETPVKSAGSTTFRREDLDRGLEADDCFYIQNVQRILGKQELDLSVDPPPDLAVEIDITRSSLDRMGIYAALRVPEVWRFDGRLLHVHVLRPDGTYEEVAASPTFPFLPLERIADFLLQSTATDDISLIRSFRHWLRTEVLPTAGN